MPNRMPPRYVPTLTEVVRQQLDASVARTESSSHSPLKAPTQAMDRNALAQEVISQVRPQLEAELRTIAMELFEAQFSTLLPALHLQIEETVRDAIERAFPNGRGSQD